MKKDVLESAQRNVHVTVVNREASTCKLQGVKFVFLFGSLDDQKVWLRTGQPSVQCVS